MTDRELADNLAQGIRCIWTDPKTVKGMKPEHGKALSRFLLYHAMRHADVPPGLFSVIELMLWDAKENDPAPPKMPFGPFADYEKVMLAMEYEASCPPKPHPNAAIQKDIGKRAGVSTRTIRDWQHKQFYRDLVSDLRKAEQGH